MDIETLTKQLKQLKKQLQGDNLSFSAMAQIVPPIAYFINRFPAVQDFVLNNTSIYFDEEKSILIIQGQSPWHNAFPLSYHFDIKNHEEQLTSTVNIEIEQQPLAGMDWLTLNPLSMDVTTSNTHPSQLTQAINETLHGSAYLLGDLIDIMVDPNDENNHFSLNASLNQLRFSTLAEHVLTNITLPSDLPDFSFTETEFRCTPSTKTFHFDAKSYDDWVLPLGIMGLQIDDISCQIHHVVDDERNDSVKLTGQLVGNTDIAGVSFDLCFAFPGNYHFTATVPKLSLSAIIQDLCGSDALMGFPAPSSVLNVNMDTVHIDAQPNSDSFSVQGSCLLGDVHLMVNKNKARWEFTCAISPIERWQFSDIDRNLHSLDGLHFTNSVLVLSNAHQTSTSSLPTRTTAATPSALIELPKETALSKGLNFIADLNASELKLDDLLGLKRLQVAALISKQPNDLLITAPIEGEFKISDNIAFGNMGLRLRPALKHFSTGIQGHVIACLDDSELLFAGIMEIHSQERKATFTATMLGEWEKPYGVKGLAVADLAIEVEASIVPPPAVSTPLVGFAGTMQIGSFSGLAAIKLDTVTPNKSMITANFNRLYLREVIQTFCDPQVMQAIPTDIQSTVLNIGLERVTIQVVPQSMQIGELTYETGFSFAGKLSITDFVTHFSFSVDYNKGFAIQAQMNTINIDNMLVITGAGKQANPMMMINLLVGKKVGVEITAMVQLLGLNSDTMISVSDTGFNFLISGTIFDSFTATIQAAGGSLQQGGDFYLKVTLQNDLMSYLREQASVTIKSGCDDAIRDLNRAQSDLERAQREVQRLHSEVNRVRNVIRQKRQQQSQALIHAQRHIKAAQDHVHHIKTDISNMRQTISRERRRDTISLRNAKQDASHSQRNVNDLQRKIDSNKRRIKTLKNDIAKKQRWLDRSPLRRKVDRGVEYAAYVTEKSKEISEIYGDINSIEAAKSAANLALEATKQIVRGIEQTMNAFPVDADPRIVALLTKKGSANATLEVAEQNVGVARNLVNTFPIDADPRIIALFTARETANTTLELAKINVEGVKISIGNLADVSMFITQYGLAGLLEVRAASFEGQLNVIHSGQVTMALKLDVMKKPTTLQFRFDFNEPLASGQTLGEELLKRLK